MVYLFCNRTFGAPFVDTAERFSASTGTPVTVVLSERRARGRARGVFGLWRRLKDRLHTRRLPQRVVDDVNSSAFLEAIARGDHGVIAGFDQIFAAPAIARFQTLVNVHPSLLPYYRGPVPSYWCIRNAEKTTGFTIHAVTTQIDSGEILYQEAVPIRPADDVESLGRRIAFAAQPAFERWLAHLADGSPWVPAKVDAARAYSHAVGYLSFPENARRPSPAGTDR